MDILFHIVAAGAMGPGHVDPRDLSPGGGDPHAFFSRVRSKGMSKALHCLR